jgi:alpha-tubulin suppressor-like RCC1 family protein
MFSLAIKQTKSLWSWGFNGNGQLGTLNTINYETPIQVGNEIDWDFISAGSSFSYAIKTDSTLWSWGYNGFGQLGNGTTSQENSPVLVAVEQDWAVVSAAKGATNGSNLFGYHAVGLSVDRSSFCSVGANYAGQLGNGNTSDRLFFICDVAPLISIKELIGSSSFSIFPNPAENSLTLELEEGNIGKVIAIEDQQGRVVFSSFCQSFLTTLDISTLLPGFYRVVIGSDSKHFVKL